MSTEDTCKGRGVSGEVKNRQGTISGGTCKMCLVIVGKLYRHNYGRRREGRREGRRREGRREGRRREGRREGRRRGDKRDGREGGGKGEKTSGEED